MTQASTVNKQYAQDFQRLRERLGDTEPSWLHDMRIRAFETFTALGFPTARRGNEPWKYTNVGPIAAATFTYDGAAEIPQVSARKVQAAVPVRKGWTNLVFVDGRYAPSLSTTPETGSGAYATTLLQALASYPEAVRRHLGAYVQSDKEAFAALNTAFMTDGAFVLIPKDTELAAPVHLAYVTTARRKGVATYPRSLVVMEANSKATVIESYVGLADDVYLTDAVTEVVVGEGAKLDHYKFLRESATSYHVSIGRLDLKRDAQVTSTFIGQGAAISRNDMHANQAEPGSSTHLWGLYVTRGTEHVDHFINIDHAAPHTTSRIYYKGILDGQSHAVYGGTVFVHRGAVKSDARQDDKNLLLSEGSEVDTKPALEIYADDIKAGHGAASGKIDENTLFYMRSRGLDLETASRLLIYGFASEVIESVKLEDFRQYLKGWFDGIVPTLSHVRFGEIT